MGQSVTERYARDLLVRLARFHGCKLKRKPCVHLWFTCDGVIVKHGEKFADYCDVKTCKDFLGCYLAGDLKKMSGTSFLDEWTSGFTNFSRLPAKSPEELDLKLSIRGF